MNINARLLNHTSFLIALVSISWYCILIATGEYVKWSYPILIGAALCKLTFVTTRPIIQPYAVDTNNGSSSSSFFNTHRQRLCTSCFTNNKSGILPSIYKSITHRLSNDTHQTNRLYILSTIILFLPCIIFYIRRVKRHLSRNSQSQMMATTIMTNSPMTLAS